MQNKINPLIFRAYDIRGIAPSDLNTETMELIGKGTGTYIKRTYNTQTMVVGHDNRLHSPELQTAFIKGIKSTGINVINAGLQTSPQIYYAVCKFNYDSGVNITASHNPKEYNGVKIVGKNAHSICGDELQEILKLIEKNDFESAQTSGTETVNNTIFDEYIKEITSKISPAQSQSNSENSTQSNSENSTQTGPLKIVIDAGNGTAGPFAPKLFKALGYEVIELFCEPDGNFPNHEANPEDEKNTRDLAQAVTANKADLGIGFDGDGDRVGIVDENGKHYSADYLLIMLARDLLAHHPQSQIVFDVKVSNILINEIKKLNGIPVMSKTGHSFIENKMHALNAPLAGEISGHLFFNKIHYDYYGFDDAFFGAAKILEILSKSGKPFSQQFKDLPEMHTTPEFKAHCPDEKKFNIVKSLTDTFTRTHNCTTIDGVRINFDENSWGAVRCSNTSPNLTLRFEAQTKERLKEIQQIMVNELKNHPEVNLEWHKE